MRALALRQREYFDLYLYSTYAVQHYVYIKGLYIELTAPSSFPGLWGFGGAEALLTRLREHAQQPIRKDVIWHDSQSERTSYEQPFS